MIIDHVNLNHIRVFECVYRMQSMTLAAQELHLTQSGVSQHIRSLEDMLGIRLFDRIRQKVVPTADANLLFERCSAGLGQIENALFQIKSGKGGQARLSGTVHLGMPIEFGNNVVLPLLANFCREHPLVRFKIKFDFASVMNELLLKGTLDFAFIDNFRMDPRIETEKVYDEILELCISEERLGKGPAPKQTRKFFESLEYVDYQENEPVLRMWFAHHLDARNIDLNVRATVMDVQAIARLIKNGVGAGILPSHLLQKLQAEDELRSASRFKEEKGRLKIHQFKGSHKPLKNPISVAYLEQRTHSSSASAVLNYLKKALPEHALLR